VRYVRLWILLLFFLAGCSVLQPSKPSLAVSINRFDVVPSGGMVPRLEIGLHLVNTGAEDVDIEGIVYEVSLQGHEVLTGVKNDLPKIEAYHEADITLSASPDLFATIGFFRDLATSESKAIEYRVDITIDTGGISRLHTTKEGTFRPDQKTKRNH